MEKTRINWIDIAKGIGIILVVLGHAIQFGNGIEYQDSGMFWNNPFFLFIYSFHMPLFIFISGYLFYKSCGKYTFVKICVNKLKSLVVPLVFWTLLTYMTCTDIRGWNMRNYIMNAVSSLWFLWAVLYCSIVMAVIHYVFKDSIILTVLIIAINFLYPDIVNSIDFKMMFPVFTIGYYANKYGLLEKLDNNKALIGLICIYVLLYVVLGKSQYVSSWKYYSMDDFINFGTVIGRLAINIIGTVTFIGLVKRFKNICDAKVIRYMGENSIGIYIISGYLFQFVYQYCSLSFEWPIMVAWVIFISLCVLLCSTGVTYAVLKTKYLKKFALGK